MQPAKVIEQNPSAISLQRAEGLGLSKAKLAEMLGVAPDALYRRPASPNAKTVTRANEMFEIIDRVTVWAGGIHQALAWYRAEPIPAFGDRTAECLVREGKAAAVRDYLDHVATGGFA